MTHNDTDWLTQDEALGFLGVSRPTLYRWIRDGRVRAYHAGRALRFMRSELEAFVRGDIPADDPLARSIAEAIAFFEERAERRRTAPPTKRRKTR